ncbi:MAG: ABC transporter ATP-binding protein [Planctomycetota bacterium]|nr:MAG: ABC transporter ATP-binding protein [Planctomycetota bacterium]
MKSVIRVEGLTKRFGRRVVLEDVSFEVPADGVTVLLGGNGAGKTTLVRCLMGLSGMDAGRIEVCGLDPARSGRGVRERVGYVPDEADAYPWMNARDLFRFLRAQYPKWDDERAYRLLERLGAPLATTFGAMSRGEAAKVMLAAALAPAPQLVLLDEPFARLAPPVREKVLGVFVEEAPIAGGAALVATHDLDVAARIADRVLVLDGGRVVVDTDVRALVAARAGGGSVRESLRALYPHREVA